MWGAQWALLLGCGQSQMKGDEGVGVTGTFCLPGSAGERLVLGNVGRLRQQHQPQKVTVDLG